MLRELRLENFRCFHDHTIPLRDRTVVIGKNNAGKSTIVEALRLLSIITERYQSLNFQKPPAWTGLPMRDAGVTPARDQFNFASDNVFHRYGEPPAVITATFTDGSNARILIGPDGAIFAQLAGPDGRIIQNKGDAKRTAFPLVAVMPQLSPVSREENVLTPDYVRRNMSSPLSSSHFRNQLRLHPRLFDAFTHLTEETWGALSVQQLDGGRGQDDPIVLMIRDGDFVSEVSAMGHGLQMWLQTMWFLARTPHVATVILDEPDVYMHPDLQRRLIRHLNKRFQQSIVTTHSVEIISECATEDILVIDRNHASSRFATSLDSVQDVIERVGSAQNLQLARLWNARKCLLVEGKDVRFLAAFHDIIFPNDQDGLSQTPHMSLGGWSGWSFAIGSRMLLRNAGGERISVYCVLDSDFHTDAAIQDRRDQAARNEVQLHIWSKKEIENFLLVPTAICRYIAQRAPRRVQPPSTDEIIAKMDELAEAQREDVFDAIANEHYQANRQRGLAGANRQARLRFDERWATFDGRMSFISGKSAIAALSRWSQETFGVTISPLSLAESFERREVHEEFSRVVQRIHHGEPI